MSKYDVVIIGGGLGGLECGLILSKEGMRVCLLEQHDQAGGNLQTFTRDGCIFDTGMHYIGSMDNGQYLHKYFSYFGIADKLYLRKLDKRGFDTLSFDQDDQEYYLDQGYEGFASGLHNQFPGEKNAIEQYISGIREVTKNFPLYNQEGAESYQIPRPILEKCTLDFLNSITGHDRLRNVLAGAWSTYPGYPGITPLYVHGLMRDSLIKSCWRPVDGSSQIAGLLVKGIEDFGGSVLTSRRVKEIIVDREQAKKVLLENGEQFSGKYFISNAHPVATLEMIGEGKIRKIYRRRIKNLENSHGVFTLYAVLKKDSFPYLNKNYFHYRNRGILHPADSAKPWPDNYYFYTPASSGSEKYAESFVAMTNMNFEEVSQWAGTGINRRGEDYKDFKAERAQQLLDAVEERFPGISGMVLKTYSSTPLTFQDYTGTYRGSAYGIMKDCHDPVRSIILPNTRISNLFFTGQNLNLHGIPGVTASAVITCSEILGLKYLTKKIANG